MVTSVLSVPQAKSPTNKVIIAPIERWLKLVEIVPGSCWRWLGSASKDGYGQFVLDGRRNRKRIRIAPYRFIWEWVNEELMAEGLEPDHTCNQRWCVNPSHIEPVTHSENQRRSYQRGRKRPVKDYFHPCQVRPTHCPKGHEYTTANMMRGGSGPLQCRTCNRLWHTRCSVISSVQQPTLNT
jgi:HNH endonuclease